jgi:hypothetical protein
LFELLFAAPSALLCLPFAWLCSLFNEEESRPTQMTNESTNIKIKLNLITESQQKRRDEAKPRNDDDLHKLNEKKKQRANL